jgi:hypothetical protein
MSKKFKKLIYIFGEEHSKIVDCEEGWNFSNIENYLQYYNSFPIAYIDYYFELPAYIVGRGYPSPDNYTLRIFRLKEVFKECIVYPEREQEENKEKCSKSRMHFFDIRQGQVKGGMCPLMLMYSEFLQLDTEIEYKKKTHNKTDEVDDEIIKYITDTIYKWTKFLEFFARFEYDNDVAYLNYQKYWYSQVLNNKFLSKEIERMDADVRPFLNYFIQKELDDTNHKNYPGLQQIAELLLILVNKDKDKDKDKPKYTYNDPYFERIIFCISQIVDPLLFDLHAIIIDAYLLARIFKTFQIYNSDTKRSVDEPAEPSNIIIYSGDLHSIRYRTFLKLLGFRTLEEAFASPAKKNCLDMKGIKQPLFSEWPKGEDNDIDLIYFYFNNSEHFFEMFKEEGYLNESELKKLKNEFNKKYKSFEDVFKTPDLPLDLLDEFLINTPMQTSTSTSPRSASPKRKKEEPEEPDEEEFQTKRRDRKDETEKMSIQTLNN